MNHKEEQQYLLNKLDKLKNAIACSRENKICRMIAINKSKQKAKAHKEEVKKGCGNIFKHGKEGEQVGCVIGELCPTCQAIIDKYSENGI